MYEDQFMTMGSESQLKQDRLFEVEEIPKSYIEEPILTPEQFLRLDCLMAAVRFHANNPNVTTTSGGPAAVMATANRFVKYVKDG